MEELMEELIYEVCKESLKELKEAKKLPYPLYYREVFNTILEEKGILNQINPKMLCINDTISETFILNTKNIIEFVQNKSKDIKNNTQYIIEEIKEQDPEILKEQIIKFSAYLLKNIEEMEKKIKELESELNKAYKELLIDPLTKIYNKKALRRDLKEILKKGKNKDLDLIIAMIDLNNFKDINITYGHLVGDFVLIKFVQILKSLISSNDKIYRFKGDVFIIVFNRTSLINAIRSVERIVNKIDKTKLKYKDQIIDINISVGLTKHKKGDDMKSLLKRAEDALSEAKISKIIYKVSL